MKKFCTLLMVVTGIISLTAMNVNAMTQVNQEVIDTYFNSKKELLIGDSNNDVSILDVLEHKKAIMQSAIEEPSNPEEPTTNEEPIYITSKGIDVSKWQGTINWSKVKSSGIDFAILRVGYTTSGGSMVKDPYFEYNYKQCKENGIAVGCYYYTRATNMAKAEKEANFVLSIIDGKQFEYPICFDIEDNSLISACSTTQRTNVVISFCRTLEAKDYYVSIYANPYWFDSLLYKDWLVDYDKWLAHWASAPKYDSSFAGMWQYGTSTCLGISGQCDMNYSYKNYPYIMKKYGLNGF